MLDILETEAVVKKVLTGGNVALGCDLDHSGPSHQRLTDH